MAVSYDPVAVLEDLRGKKRALEKRANEIRSELEDILAEQKELGPAVVYFERLVGEEAGPEEREAGRQADGRFSGMSTPDAAKAYLAEIGHPEKASKISDALQEGNVDSDAKNFYSTLYSTLRRLQEQGEVIQLEDSRWALPQHVSPPPPPPPPSS